MVYIYDNQLIQIVNDLFATIVQTYNSSSRTNPFFYRFKDIHYYIALVGLREIYRVSQITASSVSAVAWRVPNVYNVVLVRLDLNNSVHCNIYMLHVRILTMRIWQNEWSVKHSIVVIPGRSRPVTNGDIICIKMSKRRNSRKENRIKKSKYKTIKQIKLYQGKQITVKNDGTE